MNYTVIKAKTIIKYKTTRVKIKKGTHFWNLWREWCREFDKNFQI